MLDDRLRQLMRNIALGIPLAVGLAGATALAGCDESHGRGDDAGPGDAGSDAGGWDAGDWIDPGCEEWTQTVPRTGPDGGAADGGVDAGTSDPECHELCDTTSGGGPIPFGSLTGCDIREDEVDCHYYACYAVGRRPDAPYRATAPRFDDPVIAHLVQTTISEAASVPAFERLARALESHGAPAELARRARESAQDEVRHARLVAGLAQRTVGAIDVGIDIDDEPLPALFEMALHNVVEGCVGEAYAALEAAWQAQRATDPEARAVFGQIARDEAQHALLSLEIDAWARPALSDRERRALDEARRDRLGAMRDELRARAPMPSLGLPGGADAVRLLSLVV